MAKVDSVDYGEGFFVPEYKLATDGIARDVELAYGDEAGFFFAHNTKTNVEIKCEKMNDDKLILRRSEDQAVGVSFSPPGDDNVYYIWYTAYQIVGKEGSA